MNRTSTLLFVFIIFQFLILSTYAGFESVTDYNNPASLKMFKYKPANLSKGAPVVVVLHGCKQKAQSFAKESGWTTVADEQGLILLLPEQISGNNFAGCFTWFKKSEVTKGQGEIASIANAIDKLLETENASEEKVFVTGLSAGASMASALLATYPEKFMAGSIVAGVPYSCAFNISQSFRCMFTNSRKSAVELGNEVRKAAANFKGEFPLVTVIHGTSDSVVNTNNANQSLLQWTNVHGIDANADKKREITGTTLLVDQHTKNDRSVVELLIINGAGHGWPVATSKGCGSRGKFIIDNGFCTARELAKTWGLIN